MFYDPRDVNKVARELVRDYARDSLSRLILDSEPERMMAENVWPSIFRDWQEANLKYSGDRERIFSELEFAQEAESFLRQARALRANIELRRKQQKERKKCMPSK